MEEEESVNKYIDAFDYQRRQNPPHKKLKRMKEQLKTISNDINIVIEAIQNNDTSDAIQMLIDIKEDLKLLELMA